MSQGIPEIGKLENELKERSRASSMNRPSLQQERSHMSFNQTHGPPMDGKYPVINSVFDLEALPRMSPGELEEILRSQNMILGADGTLLKKHIYRVKRHKSGPCGCWNRCCCGCYDEGRACGSCNSNGFCNRKRITYRRDSGGDDASIWSAVTAIKPKKGRRCC